MTKSSYQKLKEKNEQLKQDIYELVMEPEKMKSFEIRERYRMKFEIAHIVLNGSLENRDNKVNGIIAQMSKSEKDNLFNELNP